MPRLVSMLALVVGVGLAAPPAEAQLSSAELFVNVHAGTSATDEQGHSDPQSFADGPRTTSLLPGSGTITWPLQSVVSGASARSNGQVNYLASGSQVALSGTFRIEAESTAPATALTGFDAIVKITFQVSEETPYTIGGGVSATRALSDQEVVACQINGRVLAGDTRATPLPSGAYGIADDGVAFPGESFSLECAAAASGGTADANSVTFDVTLNLGATTTSTSTTSTTLQPLTKKQCRRACRKATAACRTSCKALAKAERKVCRRDCNRRGRTCGQSTGCTLPAE